MSARVLFFGATADIVGSRELVVDEISDASAILARLRADHPQFVLHKLLISINQEFASGDAVVRDGDEVAIFTAVSGG